MKKILQFILMATGGIALAQVGNVGINTATPGARLEIVNKVAGQAPLVFRNSANTIRPMNITDGNFVGISTASVAPIAPLDVNVGSKTAYDLGCGNTNFVVGTSASHKFAWGYNFNFGSSSCNHGNTLLSGSNSINGAGAASTPGQVLYFTNDNSTDGNAPGGGVYIAPRTATGPQPAGGLYMTEDAKNGFSLPAGTLPQGMVDVNGSLMVGSNGYTDVTSAEGRKCLVRGEMIYLKHFYVCNGSPLEWKQIDN